MYDIVILDNGHGRETSGKRSPVWSDGTQLLEYEFNRDIVRRIAEMLKSDGIPYKVLVPEVVDISLGERCRRANRITQEHNGRAFLISIHANAGGGTGWEAYTSKGKTRADDIATILYDQFASDYKGIKLRKDMSDGDADKEEQFYILKHTNCPAVLTENFFMDTESDCRYIMSEVGRENIARSHYLAIRKVMNR